MYSATFFKSTNSCEGEPSRIGVIEIGTRINKYIIFLFYKKKIVLIIVKLETVKDKNYRESLVLVLFIFFYL